MEADAFRASMSMGYRNTLDDSATEEHRAIVAPKRRRSRPRRDLAFAPEGGRRDCLHRRRRRPTRVCSRSSARRWPPQNIDPVLSVRAYTRTRLDRKAPEAVDFVWFRRESDASTAIEPQDAARIVKALRGLLGGKLAPESLFPRAPPRGNVSADATGVAFAKSLDAGHSVLTVEASDRPGLLLAVTLALFRAQVQILASRADTKDGIATDRFTIAECNGRRLSPERRDEARAAVRAALEGLVSRSR